MKLSDSLRDTLSEYYKKYLEIQYEQESLYRNFMNNFKENNPDSMDIGASSSGKTQDFDSCIQGSNPCAPAIQKKLKDGEG